MESTAPIRTHREPARLSWPSFGLALAILLAIFALLNPVWESDTMGAWNENIWWSYAPIPVLVALLLRLERKLAFAPFCLETIKLTFVKFAITFLVANGLWAIWGAPGTGVDERVAPTDGGATAFEPGPAPAPSEFDPAMLATLRGVVEDDRGRPIEGALVFVSGGLEAHRFAPPERPLVLVNEGAGFLPREGVIEAYQLLRLRSADDALHTAVFADALREQRLANVPVLAGAERELMFDRGYGLLRLSCSVHADVEPPALVLSLGHPFWTRTDPGGRFEIAAVPEGLLRVRALVDDTLGDELKAELTGSEEPELVLRVSTR